MSQTFPPSDQFQRVAQIMATLRAPGGCPWDRKQTHASLKPYLLEETYEVLETIDHEDRTKLKEELGDVLLQVIFHSQIATEAGQFTIDDVLQQLADKLIRRHPHVFGTKQEAAPSLNAHQVLHRWEEIKRAERQADGQPESVLDGVPKTLPALLRAYQLQARASRIGFDWTRDAKGIAHVFGKIEEEIHELRAALATSAPAAGHPSVGSPPPASDAVIAEVGDVLFSLVNLARLITVDPEDALRLASTRFADRFAYIEQEAARSGRRISDLSLSEMNALWEQAKRQTAQELRAGPHRPTDTQALTGESQS